MMRSTLLTWSQTKQSNLGFVDRYVLGVPVKPSDKVYFDKYYYKVTVEGAYVYHDIELHANISMWFAMYNSDDWRQYWGTKGRTFYVKDYQMLLDFVIDWKEYVLQVDGPVNAKHLKLLTEPTDDYTCTEDLRDKLYFRKYRNKIEFSTWNARSINSYASGNVDDLFVDIDKLVSSQTTHYKWHQRPHAGLRMFYNFLYIKEEDYEHVLTMLLLNYKKYIRQKYKVIVYNDLEK